MAQSPGGQKRPIGFAQELARQNHHIRLPGANNLVRLRSIRNHSYGSGWDATLAANLFCKRHLITGANRYFCIGDIPTG